MAENNLTPPSCERFEEKFILTPALTFFIGVTFLAPAMKGVILTVIFLALCSVMAAVVLHVHVARGVNVFFNHVQYLVFNGIGYVSLNSLLRLVEFTYVDPDIMCGIGFAGSFIYTIYFKKS